MHNAAFSAMGMDGVYLRLPVREEGLKEAVIGLRALGFRGVNVTVPHKERITEYLDNVTEVVEEIGALNTISMEDNRLVGDNTDVHGFRESLREYKIEIENQNVLLIGAGGAARASIYVIHSMRPKRLVITDKMLERAKSLSHVYGGEIIKPDTLKKAVSETDVVINATPADLKKTVLPMMRKGSIYYDMNYRYSAMKKEGIKVIDGMLMLILQGASAFALWTKISPPIKAMKQAVGYEEN